MESSDNEIMRLSKRMAQLGLCSRREADSYIEQGWVSVNGQVAVLGQKVTTADRIDLNKQAHERQAERVSILINMSLYVLLVMASNNLNQDAAGMAIGFFFSIALVFTPLFLISYILFEISRKGKSIEKNILNTRSI